MNIADCEQVLVARVEGGRLRYSGMALTSARADQLADELSTAAIPSAGSLVLIRARGGELSRLEVTIEADHAERIIAAAVADRVL